MTTEFNKYIQQLLREMTYANLPSAPPYGFWVSPNLELFPVPFEGHAKIASQIVNKNKKLYREYTKAKKEADLKMEWLSPSEFLKKKKYTSIVFSSRLQSNKKLAYEGHPEPKQLSLIKDIGLFYDYTVESDTAESRKRRIMGFYEDILYESLYAEDLKDKHYYGLWILPNGAIELVNFQQHEIAARNIIRDNKWLRKKFIEYQHVEDFPRKIDQMAPSVYFDWFYYVHGACRLIKENRHFLGSFGKLPTNAIKRTIREIKDLLEVEVTLNSDIIK